MDELREAYINNLLYNSGLYMYSEFMNLSEEEQLGEIKNKYYEQVRKDCSYNMNYVPAATTSIISVVQLNDEIKDSSGNIYLNSDSIPCWLQQSFLRMHWIARIRC